MGPLGFCPACGRPSEGGQARCQNCGAPLRSALLPVLLLLLAAAEALVYVSARYYVPAFLWTISYLNDLFAERPAFPGLGALVAVDRAYVRYLFWPGLAGTLRAAVLAFVRGRRGPIPPAPGRGAAAAAAALGALALGLIALQLVPIRIYSRMLPEVLILLPDHLAYRAQRLAEAGRLDEAEVLLRRALDGIPPRDKSRRGEMKAALDRLRLPAAKKATPR